MSTFALSSSLLPSLTKNEKKKKKVVVFGGTGATGKHAVRMLMDREDTTVVAVARSKEKMKSLLNELDGKDEGGQDQKKKEIERLTVEEASVADLSSDDIRELTKDCDAIICCLGHNLTFRGMFLNGFFIRNAVEKITGNMPSGCRFVLMSSVAVTHPDGVTDPKRTLTERSVLFLLQYLLPAHRDNELVAAYLQESYDQKSQQEQQKIQSAPFDWCAVRPGELIDREEGEGCSKIGNGGDGDDDDEEEENTDGYDVFDRVPAGSLFGGDSAFAITRYDVADFMVRLATMEQNTWNEQYNHKMPVLYQKKKTADELKKYK